MKFMKRAYAKVWQNYPKDEREDTTTTLLDYEDANELNSIPGRPPIPAGVSCVRQQYGRIQHSRMLPYSRIVRPHKLRQNLPGHAQQNRRLLDTHEVHHRQSETRGRYPARLLLSSMRSVDLAGHHTTLHQRTTRKRRRILPTNPRNLQEQPRPLFCHNCGQRFKYVGQDQLAYKHQSNRADILRTLKLKAETQPTFDLAEVNQ